MGVKSYKSKQGGFAVIEAVLVLVIIAAIVGIGAYVLRQKHNANATLSTAGSSTAATAKAPAGTTASINQLTQQDASAETAADKSGDASLNQDAGSANAAVNNVGGAYNEANY